MKRFPYTSFAVLLFLIVSKVTAQTPVVPSSEILLNLKKLNMLGSVLYIAAHPDDENTLMLAYLSKDRLARTGYLSLTRGDGGQNLIGAEQGYNIGLIRTQELLAARRIDGAEQFFSRAYDFGFSKTLDETLNFWDREKVLGDVVWMIRKYQPDVVITRFPPDPRAGHGHHQTSAFLAEEAFKLAGNPASYPDQLKYVKTWQPKRITWNTYSRGFTNQAPTEEKAPYIAVELGGFNPLLGKSYSEIAAESRSQHKSQGFGSSPVRDVRTDYLVHTAGDPAQKDLFDGVDTSWNRVPGSAEVARLVSQVITNFNVAKPEASVPTLVRIHQQLSKLDPSQILVQAKKQEVEKLIQQCLGLWFETNPTEYSAVPGTQVSLKVNVVKRADYPVKLVGLQWTGRAADSTFSTSLALHKAVNVTLNTQLPDNLPVSQPYWLEKPLSKGVFQIDDQRAIGFPENTPLTLTKFTFEIDGQPFTFSKPWTYKFNDPVAGEQYRPFEIRPAVTATLNEPVFIFTTNSPREVQVLVKAQKKGMQGTLRPQVPAGWKVEPASRPFQFNDKYQEEAFSFTITPPNQNQEVTLRAIATVDGQSYATAMKTIEYPHIPSQTIFPPAEAKLARVDVKMLARRIGYIAGAGDDVPAALRQMGATVVMLNGEELSKDLSTYDAIVVGVRAYNTEERLRFFQDKLMNYVKNGGTMLVQYTTSNGLKVPQLGPYPFKLGRDRVSEEEAEMRVLKPAHPLLNAPNKITARDFDGWIQERGLYFAEEWDPAYQAILSGNDVGETPKDGSLLYAPYGKGHFIYTGLSFFRELPAGVTGAYRLFANLVSAGKTK
ncbi:PIG-L family deacetylase [Telluribacter sp.]|jgi:LmbE family N-acetylglucosaminyl deacetylase|uniref:PIG-L family deacetylase n=1 Tax=Telluribacter sp. TaxID=1978767 RepID=UPI002E158645|nr:PIG-L family deacetylase [Telluribacter sp.]